MMRRLICLFLIMASGAQAEPVSPFRAAVYIAFASAVSSDDPAVMGLARQYVATPPTDDEIIGFYSLSEAPSPERVLRAIVSVLVDKGYLLDLEVRYLGTDFQPSLEGAGALGAITNVPDLLTAMPDGDWSDPAFQSEAMDVLARLIGPFARAIEAEAAARDRAILQLTVPLGDAVFYWVTTPETAAEWRCILLWSGPDIWRAGQTIDISVTSVDWRLFYDLMRIGPTGGDTVDPALLDVPVTPCVAPQA